MNVFRKGDDFVIITEIPGVKKSDLDLQVKGRTLRLSGEKAATFPEKAAVHRRERLQGRFDRAVTLPVEIDADGVKAEYRNGILVLSCRARRARSQGPSRSAETATHEQGHEGKGRHHGREEGNGSSRERRNWSARRRKRFPAGISSPTPTFTKRTKR